MTNTTIKERITATLNNLTNNDDPLAKLRNSDFIGCIEYHPDLAEQSEAIAHQILSQKDAN